ncbi:hypothetical protein RhiirA1_403438 [Rhizophagus irregularis]|uniref:Uncharacterized protein n=1 Tax=Rhizophagus irregularis TaxID=588596 RepID=A0A2N0QUJ8_9GLOM|nr:hypothetical protein RhiirA1_403438 [Rhizophagus irregularis]
MNKENLKEVIEVFSLNFDKKKCTKCSCIIKKADFFSSRGNNLPYEHLTCNKCYEKCDSFSENHENNIDEYNDGTDGLLYGLDKIQELLISKQFQKDPRHHIYNS